MDMATIRPRQRVQWLFCTAVLLLSGTACSAQAPTTSKKAPVPHSDRHAAAEEAALSNDLLRSGEYITEKGWGRLLLKERGDALAFSIKSVTGEDACELAGSIRGNQGVANNDGGPSSCSVKFASTPQGIEVASSTPTECKMFCGYNGSFEGIYLRIKDGCGRDDLDGTRKAFKKLYDQRDYKSALATLSPVLADCQPTLDWEEEGGIRNDLAITQYKDGLYAECLATLDEYAEDASKNDDAVIEGWTPALAGRYLAIIKAARTNIGLCRNGTMAAHAISQSTVVEELSSRSRIPVPELQQLLDDCDLTQRSMNICAFRDFVASDLELGAALRAKRESLPQQCRAEIDRNQAAWETERDNACIEETEADEGGSMRPMLISACKTTATRARMSWVKEIKKACQ